MDSEKPREEKMLEAMRFVRQYVKANGGNPYGIDWEDKPNNLPEEVSRAWDDYVSFWEETKRLGIMP